MSSHWTPAGPTGVIGRTVAGPDGRDWRLTVALPQGEAPQGGWPSVWVLDGGLHGFTLIETARRLARRPAKTRAGAMAVIAVSLAAADHDPAQRYLDFTEGPTDFPDPKLAQAVAGGAAAFLDLLAGPLFEAAREAGPLDPDRRGLWGHSLAGRFVLWASTKTDAWAACAAVSPSLWWAPTPQTATPAFIAGGEREENAARPDPRGMIRRAREYAEAGGASLMVCPDEDHASTVTASAAAALRFFWTALAAD